MAPILHCVRHAEGFHNLSVANHAIQDPHLTPYGKTQCRQLRDKFPHQHSIDLIVTSPLYRTIQTSVIAFAPIIQRGVRIVAHPDAQETGAIPSDRGSDIEDVKSDWAVYGEKVDLSLLYDGWNAKQGRFAPEVPAITARARDLRRWLKDRPEKEIIFVGHGGFLHYFTEDFTDCNKFAGTPQPSYFLTFDQGTDRGGVLKIGMRSSCQGAQSSVKCFWQGAKGWAVPTRNNQQRRLISSISSLQPTKVQLKGSSDGSSSLEIYHPSSASTPHSAIIYIPRGPIPEGKQPLPTPPTAASLAVSANIPVVQINYRLSKQYRYPAPLHDVAAGYDWVVKHLIRSAATKISPNGFSSPGRIGVCGELIGGSLAAAMSLTECHARGTAIVAAALGNPISDWTAMHAINEEQSSDLLIWSEQTAVGSEKKEPRPKTKGSIQSSWAASSSSPWLPTRSFLVARNAFFRTREACFDPFASPLLFFRAPSSDAPPGHQDPLDELFAEMDIEVRQFARKKRRAHLRYPPAQSGLHLPDVRLWVGQENVLRDQGMELAEMIARSLNLYGNEYGVGGDQEAERVSVQMKNGVGLWEERDIVSIGTWFGHVLRACDRP